MSGDVLAVRVDEGLREAVARSFYERQTADPSGWNGTAFTPPLPDHFRQGYLDAADAVLAVIRERGEVMDEQRRVCHVAKPEPHQVPETRHVTTWRAS